jgi:hypothetical protein
VLAMCGSVPGACMQLQCTAVTLQLLLSQHVSRPGREVKGKGSAQCGECGEFPEPDRQVSAGDNEPNHTCARV